MAKKFLMDFALTFALVFMVAVAVTLVWNLVFHSRGAVAWETAFRLALVLGVALPLIRFRDRWISKRVGE